MSIDKMDGAPGRAPSSASDKQVIKSYAPASGELLGEIPVMSAEEIRAAVGRAARAQESWGALPVEERCRRLERLRDALLEREEELSHTIARETGKPQIEAMLHEVGPSVMILNYFMKHGPQILAPKELPLSLMAHRKSVLHYMPRGVVGLITPWNFPFLMPMRDLIIAAVAGNAVVLKPSEVTTVVAIKAKQVWDRAGLPPDLFQVVPGYGPAGQALIDAGIQFCVFTGGVSTGKRVAAACGERLVPCVMELGGKAPLIVCRDADVELAARAAVFGGFTNAGQVCISVERVYAHRDIADKFTSRVVELTKNLRVGDSLEVPADVGAIIFPKQIDIAEAHINDAVSKGAQVLAGGKRIEGKGRFFEPTVLGDCNHSMTVMTDEIFGPIVPIMRVSSDEEALRLSNESHLGLNAYVFTKDRAYGEKLATQVEAGSVLVNDVVTNGGMPDAPFGGIKQSGFGRVMGDDSLREMCNVKHVSVDRVSVGSDNPLWFPYGDKTLRIARKALKVMMSGSLVKRLTHLL